MTTPHRSPLPLINPLHNFVLFTNAKCGGTTMKAWFLQTLDRDRSLSNPVSALRHFGPGFTLRWYLDDQRFRSMSASAICESTEVLRRFITFYRNAYSARHMAEIGTNGMFRFAVVRDPYDRIVSGFVDKFCGDDLQQPWVQEIVNVVAAKNGGRRSVSFRQFMDYLSTAADRDLNAHWRRQTYVLDDVDLDAFVRVESLSAEVAAIEQRLGLSHDPAVLRKRQDNVYLQDSREPTSNAGFCGDVANDELMRIRSSAGAFPVKSSFFDRQTREQTERVYLKDFERLPYQRIRE